MDQSHLSQLRRQRLEKIQMAMAERKIGALLLTDPIHIRYATGISVMPLWTAVNYARYTVIPVQGEPTLFEYPEAQFRSSTVWNDTRPTKYWQFRFSQDHPTEAASRWAKEITELLREKHLDQSKLGVDSLDFYGFHALQSQRLRLCDADEPLQQARRFKSELEVSLMRESAEITQNALDAFRKAIEPGVSENELLGVFWKRMLDLGGEWCYTRLVASGNSTNPWFQEASDRLVQSGDLVAIDTDLIGPEGYACDISRTFLCGLNPTPRQRELYRKAHDFVVGCAELLRPGMSYRELTEKIPPLDKQFMAQRYPIWLHGIGVDDEPPFVPIPDSTRTPIPEGMLEKNMVVCVECYAGAQGEGEGVKLEDQYLITDKGAEKLCHYPYESYLL